MLDVSTPLQSQKPRSGYPKRSFLREAMYPITKDILELHLRWGAKDCIRRLGE